MQILPLIVQNKRIHSPFKHLPVERMDFTKYLTSISIATKETIKWLIESSEEGLILIEHKHIDKEGRKQNSKNRI